MSQTNERTDNKRIMSRKSNRRIQRESEGINVIFSLLSGSYVLLILLLATQLASTLQSTSSWTNYKQQLNNNASRTSNDNSNNKISLIIFNTTSINYEPPAISTTTLATLVAPQVRSQNLTAVRSSSTSSELEAATATTTDASVESTDSDVDSAETTTTIASVDDDDSSHEKGKLVKTLTETASDAADKLVDRLKPAKSQEEPEAEAEDDSSDDETETIEEAATQAPIAKKANIATTTATPSRLSRGNESNKKLLAPEKLISSVNGSSLSEMSKLRNSQLKHALDTYEIWKSSGEDLIELISRKLLPLVMEHGYEVDPVTVTGLLQVFNGLRGLKPWAMKLLDASTKLSPGILLGTQSDFGDYDECLNVRVDDPAGLGLEMSQVELDPATGLPQSTIVGRYCLADVEFPKPPRAGPIELLQPLYDFAQSPSFRDTIWVETGNFFHMLYVDPIRTAICLTNKIEPESFSQVFNKVFAEFRVTINFRGRCVTKYEKREWTQFQVVSAWFLSLACCFVAISTLLELFAIKLKKLPARFKCQLALDEFFEAHKLVLTSFSLLRNTRRLFKVPQEHAAPSQVVAIAQQQQQASMTCSTSSSLESSPQIDRRSSSATSNGDLQSTTGGSACQLLSFKNGANLASQLELANSTSKSKNLALTGSTSHQLDLNCLHGIRVITMTWMIVNHTYMFGGFFVLWAHRRLIDIAEWPKSLSFQLVLNGWLTVETYFFLSALIIIINVMPLMKIAKFSYVNFIVHRLIRLVPAYAGLVALNFLWPLISSGPVWLVKGRDFIETPCENYLWTNFVFINNWIWPENQCMVHTWFLSADFQLYLLAPLIVYLLCKRPVLGHSLNIMIAICASILSGFVIYANNLLPATLINKLEFDSIKQQLSYSYFATYQHMGPYCLGLFVGYILHKRPAIRLPSHLTWLLWLLLPPLSFSTLLLTYLWNGAYKEPSMINPSPLISAFYIAIHRIIWSSLTAWIVFACVTRRAKLLTSFLSHHYFVPISRLSFSIYLVHMPLIMYRALNMRHTKEWTDGNILWEACGNFVTSCLLGYFLNVCFESPFINLEQALFRRKSLQVGPNSSALPSSVSNCDSSANNSPSIHKREPPTQFEKHHQACSPAETERASSSAHSDNDSSTQESKQLKRLVDDELFTIENGFRANRMQAQLTRSSLRREPSLAPRPDLADEEIYQLESENYHNYQSPYVASSRPAHYATLARTSRFSQQDMSNILSQRQVPINSRNSTDLRHQQQHVINQAPRRKASYNTLTSSRDWAQHQHLERQERQSNAFNWNQSALLSPRQATHYMIPRIEPSTLTRPRPANMQLASSRFLHASRAQTMPIAEEPPTMAEAMSASEQEHEKQ